MRLLLSILGIAFAALIGWAIMTGGFAEAGRFLITDPWGIVTLSDLYLGLFIAGVFIFLVERNTTRAILWCLPLPFLGNVWTVVWLVLRWPTLKSAISARR